MHKWPAKISPLSWRLVAATVAFSTLVAILATALQLYVDYRRDLSDIASTFDQVEQSYLPTIANALWATNHQELQVAINGLVRLPDARYVAVMENHKVWAEAGSPKTQAVQSREFQLAREHRGETLNIGSMVVVMDMEGVYKRLLEKFWVILASNAIKTSLVAGFIFWLFHRLVTRHLRRIADFSEQLNADNLHEQLTLDRDRHPQGKQDEFDLVVDGLARMQSKLRSAILTLEEDIYKLEQAETEIYQLNSALETRVAERTAQLEAVNRELEAFSYSVSHDLRTPLRSIDGFSQALEEDYSDRLDATGLDYLTRVRKAAQRMGTLIDDLLRLARITRAEMKILPVDLSEMAHEVIGDLRKHKGYGAATFGIQPGMVVHGDPGLLRILMENLLDNAWKYSSKIDHAMIMVGTEEVEGRTVFVVRDNGVGFDMTYVHKLFGAFQRLHRTDEFPGTGIGLATVKRILHRHGGEIWAEGKPGQGAIFRFTVHN